MSKIDSNLTKLSRNSLLLRFKEATKKALIGLINQCLIWIIIQGSSLLKSGRRRSGLILWVLTLKGVHNWRRILFRIHPLSNNCHGPVSSDEFWVDSVNIT